MIIMIDGDVVIYKNWRNRVLQKAREFVFIFIVLIRELHS